MNDVSQWLEAHDLGDYAGVLAKHQVDWQALSQLTANDLKEMELPLGPRRKLLTAIGELASSSKGSFRQLIENSELGVIITNTEGVLFVNDVVFRMIGMERPDVLPPDFRFVDYHSEEDRAFLHDRWRRRARGEEVSPTFEFPYRPHGGEPFWTLNYVQEIVWEGEPALLTWVTDINELKRAEANVRHSEQQFRDLAEGSLQGIFIADENWKPLYVNQAAYERNNCVALRVLSSWGVRTRETILNGPA